MQPNDLDPAYWFQLAADDEASARILARESGPPDIAVYHFHQAIEKLLKAHIAKSGATIPPIPISAIHVAIGLILRLSNA